MQKSEFSQTPRLELASAIVDAKARKGLTFQDLTDGSGLSVGFLTAALLGQHPLPREAAELVSKRLDLDADAVALLQSIPLRGSFPDGVPVDSTIYRFYDILQIYGPTLKALIHELFGDGIISAINFKLDIKKVDDPEGGSRAVITFDGKFLPVRPY
jgi:cyanate lyase